MLRFYWLTCFTPNERIYEDQIHVVYIKGHIKILTSQDKKETNKIKVQPSIANMQQPTRTAFLDESPEKKLQYFYYPINHNNQ